MRNAASALSRIMCISLLAAGFLVHGPAFAGDDVDATKFRPSPHPYDVLTVKFSDVPSGLHLGGGLLAQFSQNALVFVRDTGSRQESQRLVKDRLTLDLLGSFTFGDRYSIGVLLPIAVVNTGEAGFTGLTLDEGAGLGDVGLSFKAAILQREGKGDGFGLALALDGKLPTGRAGGMLRDGGLSIAPQIIADVSYSGYRASLNVAYVVRPEAKLLELLVDDEIDIRFGLELPVYEGLSLLGQLATTTVASDFFSERNTNYVEVDGGLRYRHASGFLGMIGAGGSFARGYGNVKMRIFGQVGYEPPLEPPDGDGDGIIDALDRCPADPEDFDQYEDRDGCPEADNDDDGLPDAEDRCPLDKEDKDGFQDDDGCPDYDNDQDGISDANDLCTQQAEDFDGFEDTDGCPEPDNDEDGIKDADDTCPLEAETRNGYQDEDGCPDIPPRVEIQKEKIVIRDRVYFATNRARIKKASFGLLDEVAEVIVQNPVIRKIRVEGHTDNVGRRRYNQKLSARRARAVAKYLMSKGVDRSRLEWKGLGPDKPIAENDTDEGRAKNRRVEFVILERAP